MAGGSIISTNKIGRGNALRWCLTGVAPAAVGRLGNFGRRDLAGASSTRRSIAGGPAAARMAENCGFRSIGGSPVARSASHGGDKGKRNQALGRARRLTAGLTAGPDGRLAQLARRASAQGGASPFGPRPGATKVASESRQIHKIRGQGRPDQCLRLRLSREPSKSSDRVGAGAFSLTPGNGVGGASGAPVARNGSAGRERGAEDHQFGGVRHEARAPLVERGGEATPHAPTVNKPAQKSVEKSL